MRIIILLVFVGILVSCSDDRSADLMKVEEASKQFYGEDSTQFEASKQNADVYIQALEEYIEKFPDDERVPRFMFKIAEASRLTAQFDKAIFYWAKLEADYENFEKTPHSIFLTAFTFENNLNDQDMAAKTYRRFLEKYPEHELADDAKFSLDYLGKTPEEILEDFQKKIEGNKPS